MERATQFVCKMVDDDECSLFGFAVCQAFAVLGVAIADSGNMEYLEDEGVASAVKHALTLRDVNDRVYKEYGSGDYFKVINARLEAAWQRRKEHQDLPKGD
jgi:hypothetical protein